MAAVMDGANRGFVPNLIAGGAGSGKEVDILKPERVKLFVETGKFLPNVPAEQEEGSGGLLNGLRISKTQIGATIAAVNGVTGPETVDPHTFEGKCGQGG
jgi:hypothetical protein